MKMKMPSPGLCGKSRIAKTVGSAKRVAGAVNPLRKPALMTPAQRDAETILDLNDKFVKLEQKHYEVTSALRTQNRRLHFRLGTETTFGDYCMIENKDAADSIENILVGEIGAERTGFLLAENDGEIGIVVKKYIANKGFEAPKFGEKHPSDFCKDLYDQRTMAEENDRIAGEEAEKEGRMIENMGRNKGSNISTIGTLHGGRVYMAGAPPNGVKVPNSVPAAGTKEGDTKPRAKKKQRTTTTHISVTTNEYIG
jgi:hypothetical protein